MGEILTVNISSLAFGGAGVGRQEGKVVFVPGAFPGETVSVSIRQDHARYADAELVRVETPSPRRRASACPHDAECGGCPLLRLEYSAQLEWKREMVAEQFSRIAKMDVEVLPVVPSPDEFGYRARARLKAGMAGGAMKIGFCRPKSHHIVEVGRCPVVNGAINALIPELRRFFAGNPMPSVSAVKLETGFPAQGGRVALESEGAVPGGYLEQLLAACPSAKGASAVWQQGARHCGDTSLDVRIAEGISLRYGPGVFSQINPRANMVLLEKAQRVVRPVPGQTVLDLYCGAGNITFPLAMAGAVVTGVEFSREAVRDAEENRARLGLSAATFVQGDAGKHARLMAKEGRTFDTVVLDPPRGGVPGLAPTLSALAGSRIVYISCYPPALARDAAEIARHGFRPVSVQPVDMFPHTTHVESVALFERG